MGTPVTASRPSFYARTGRPLDDLVALLHLPYTAWNLAYVAIGAALAPAIDGLRLGGTLLAFFFGLGIGAHALDELHDRPLSTGLSRRTLSALGWGGLAAGGAVAVAGAVVISPVVLGWGAVGVVLAAAYSLEWSRWVHSDLGFAVSWAAFPVLVGYWAQTESIGPAAVVVAAGATAFALAQRRLSTPARHLRRRVDAAQARIGDESWDKEQLLATWEGPLRSMAAGHVVVAVGLLMSRML